MEIEQLLKQYFEGRTTAEEEATLRRFFTTGDVPDPLRIYKPLFVHFDNEARKQSETPPVFENNRQTGRSKTRKTFILWMSGIAASAAILTGLFFVGAPPNACPGSGNYVMINGRCYTDAATIRSTALKTLLDVSEQKELTPDHKPSNVKDMIENQLKDFDFLLLPKE